MARIEQITKEINGVETEIYPVTIHQSVVDESNNETLDVTLGKKAEHGYESNPKTLKEVDGNLAQLAGEVSLLSDDATVKMENLVVNGDFRNGATGWPTLGTPYAISITDKMIFNGTAGSSAGRYQDIAATTGDKLYIAIKSTSADTGFPLVRLYDFNTTNNVFNTGINNTVSSDIVDSKINGIRLYFQQVNGSVYNNVTIDDVICINLTETFGAGNEPTKEEMDLLIDILGLDYFEGEITIPAQKVMQWELAMIRQNRNAIIALGGTII